jgi:hypothetical protein
MIVASWSTVNLAAIINCFGKAGFIATHIPRRNEDVYDIREDYRDLSFEMMPLILLFVMMVFTHQDSALKTCNAAEETW